MNRTRTYRIAGMMVVSLLCARAVMAQPAPPVDVALPMLPNVPPTAPALPDVAGTAPPAPMLPPAAPEAGALPPGANLPVLPQQPAPVANTADPTMAEPVPPANDGLPEHSYGDSAVSILFLPEQIEQLKAAALAFESTGAQQAAPTPVAPVATGAAPQPIPEPPSYPVFYLSTIAFDAPNDWSIWVSGEKITSHKNGTDINVLNVTRDSVTFTWLPTYSEAIARRLETNDFAKPDAVKNKLAVAQPIERDPANGTITFTLRQNQSFATAYFKLFEGYMENPALPPLVVTPGAPGAVPVGAVPPQDGGMPAPSPAQASPQDPAAAMAASPRSILPNAR